MTLRWGIDVTGKVKFPTAADSARIGTGSTDWSLQGKVTRYFGDSGVLMRLGKKITGASELYALANPLNVGAGAFFTRGDSIIALDYDRRGSSFEGGIDRDEITLSFSHALRPDLHFQAYGFVSRTAGRTDIGLGTQMAVQFGS